MFTVTFLRKNKIFEEHQFVTERAARDFLSEKECELPDTSYDWQLYDSEKDDVIDSGEMEETSQDAIDTAYDNLYPDGDPED